jgi:hypothetical protein
MKRKYLMIVGFLLSLLFFRLFFIRSDKSKGKLSATVQICDKHLFVETYKIFESGAYGGDRVSDYLTDSATFRMYVGTFDNGKERFKYQCTGDSIYLSKISFVEEGMPYKTKTISKIVYKRAYSLLDLKKKKVFE